MLAALGTKRLKMKIERWQHDTAASEISCSERERIVALRRARQYIHAARQAENAGGTSVKVLGLHKNEIDRDIDEIYSGKNRPPLGNESRMGHN